MSALVTTLPSARALMPTALPPASPHSSAKLAAASKRALFVGAVQECMQSTGWTLNRAAEHIHALALAPDHRLHKLALELGNKGQLVGKAQIVRWVQAADEQGKQALVDGRSGRKRQEYGWEHRAGYLYARPQKPSYQFVADQLKREGFTTATPSRVRNYLLSLPTNKTSHSSGRLGAKEVSLNHRRYVRRTTENLKVGDLYEMDGHTVDVYITRPSTGKAYRPELTVVLDVASRYIAGWWLSEKESAESTLYALAEAMRVHDHVPTTLHLDNGSGFKAKALNDQSVGFYAKFGISTTFAHPGNSKGKGHVERFFLTFEEGFGKQWDSYCGKDMAKSVIAKIVREAADGKYQLPSIYQFAYALEQWIQEYNQRPHDGLDGRTPAELWASLERSPVYIPEATVFMPRQTVKIRRLSFRLNKHEYTHPDLLGYEGKQLIAEWSMKDARHCRILLEDGRWLCDAKLIEAIDMLPLSWSEANRIKRDRSKIKRLNNHILEIEQRNVAFIDQDPRNTALLAMNTPQKKSGAEAPQNSLDHAFLIPSETRDDDLLIDLTSWSPKQREEENNQF